MEGWNVGWDGDWIANRNAFSFTKPYPDYDLPGVAAYAKQKGVKLIVHNETSGGMANYERQLDSAFTLYRSLGVDAIKTGYVTDTVGGRHSHHSQLLCATIARSSRRRRNTASWWTSTSRFTIPASAAPIRT